MPKDMTVQEARELLRPGERVVYTLCRSGELPRAVKIGNQWRVEREKLPKRLDQGAAADHPQQGAERE